MKNKSDMYLILEKVSKKMDKIEADIIDNEEKIENLQIKIINMICKEMFKQRGN